jgi:putative transposon-encoded protein
MEKSRVFTKKTVKVGNSSGVLLPKKLLGAEVRVIVLKTKGNLKREILRLIEPITERVLGAYVLSSSESFSDVLVISDSIRKTISKEKYKVEIVPYGLIKKSVLLNKPVAEKLKNSRVLINRFLLSQIFKK